MPYKKDLEESYVELLNEDLRIRLSKIRSMIESINKDIEECDIESFVDKYTRLKDYVIDTVHFIGTNPEISDKIALLDKFDVTIEELPTKLDNTCFCINKKLLE